MAVYRGTAPLKAYKGDMQPVNVYKGSTKVAGWHASSTSGQSPLAVDCDYNVPPDALVIDGKCSQAQSCWGTNLVTNGDFSNGATGWGLSNTTITVENNKVDVVTNNSTSEHFLGQIISITPIAGHKYYGRVWCDPIAGQAYVQMYNRKSDGSYEQLLPSGMKTAGISSGVIVVTSVYQTPNVIFRLRLLNASGAVNFTGAAEESKFSYACMIDLTSAFGAGKEPTAAQMDAIMAAFPNSWFNGSAQLSTDITTYTPNSPSPSFPAPISTITGDVGITGTDGAASNTATIAFGSAVCASLPDGTHDSYDAVSGILTKRVDKFIGSSSTSWTLSDAATNGSFMCDKLPAGNLSGQTLSSPSACAPTVYYALATPTTVQLTPHLPVVRTGVKTLSIGADVAPTLSATVKSMD